MTSNPRSRKRTRIAIAVGTTAAVAVAGTTAAQAAGWWQSAPSHDFAANADSFSGHGTVTGNVLRNDFG
ncbi:MAG: esterase-like of phytase family protein, partial [Mycobacterium sp.]|nr:esterase-like of phytase family protein [Mycobacterium sp.]